MKIIDYIGLGLLFFSILYSGRQIGQYIRLRRTMGVLVLSLSPSTAQKKIFFGAGSLFLAVMILVTYNYVASGTKLGVAYAVILGVVIYSLGRVFSKITELRDKGLLGHLNEISYGDIKSYKVEERPSRGMLTFMLKDGREFITLIGLSDIEKAREILKDKLS